MNDYINYKFYTTSKWHINLLHLRHNSFRSNANGLFSYNTLVNPIIILLIFDMQNNLDN